MSEDRAGNDIKARVESLIEAAEGAAIGHISPAARDNLTNALTYDLGVAADQATGDRERLDKLETQTRVLADAVIAIADTGPSVAVAPAVQAVKAEMSSHVTPAPTTKPSS